LDAEKKSDLRVRRDAYLESVEAAKQREDVLLPVLLGAVLPASTTGLKAQGVSYVFHAAMGEGYVDEGYSAKEHAIQPGIERCFELFSELGKSERLESMLFPVFGGGNPRPRPDQIAKYMIPAIQNGMEQHPKGGASRCLRAWKLTAAHCTPPRLQQGGKDAGNVVDWAKTNQLQHRIQMPAVVSGVLYVFWHRSADATRVCA
jgi:hypothetical protein